MNVHSTILERLCSIFCEYKSNAACILRKGYAIAVLKLTGINIRYITLCAVSNTYNRVVIRIRIVYCIFDHDTAEPLRLVESRKNNSVVPVPVAKIGTAAPELCIY